jgi:hypothetical protein
MSTLLRLRLIPLGLAFLIAPVSCGDDDDDSGGAGTGGSAGSGGTSGAEQCKGVYADKTESEVAVEAGDGACTSAADLAAVCANDVNTTAASCGLSCFAQGGDEATQIQCNLSCVTTATDPDPSSACIGCYLESVACARENCLDQCLSDPTAPACIQCRADEGCTGGFYTCSGLPLPTGTSLGSGGQGGQPGSGGAGGGGD